MNQTKQDISFLPDGKLMWSITGSIAGSEMLVILIVLIGVCICRKRRLHRKNEEYIGRRSNASQHSSGEERNCEYSSAVQSIKSGHIYSLNNNPPDDTAQIDINVDNESCACASISIPQTPAFVTDNTYDTICDVMKPRFDDTYDHVIEEYDNTIFLTIHTIPDANDTYDHVTIRSDEVTIPR